ncbi:MAG: acetyl-CoA carboxylase, carboxyltransferase subunit beta [Alphaproteobacteria bacterium]|nr:acetyl-CoA carboxylase, carboxyltransferase subunit beta [Alphaproteobacteria bacterium]
MNNWLNNFIRPKIRSLVGTQKDVPDNLWDKCPSCDNMVFHRELTENDFVCHHCDFHMAISAEDRLALMFDGGKYSRHKNKSVPADPLKFKDRKKYADRLKDTRAKTNEDDAIIIASGKIGGNPVVIALFNFKFMGGSMGAAVGEGIVTAAEIAVKTKSALIAVPASGGARMQEGAISLMQMPRTIIAVNRVKKARLPYIVLLTNPTTGGVSASFAMVGDIHIAEPGATIGFAGKRVIQETIREELPDDFQTAEYLLEHGMVDMVVPRAELNAVIGQTLSLLMNTKIADNPKGKKNKTTKNTENSKSVVSVASVSSSGEKMEAVNEDSARNVAKKSA